MADDLDDILESALEDFENDEKILSVATQPTPAPAPAPVPVSTPTMTPKTPPTPPNSVSNLGEAPQKENEPSFDEFTSQLKKLMENLNVGEKGDPNADPLANLSEEEMQKFSKLFEDLMGPMAEPPKESKPTTKTTTTTTTTTTTSPSTATSSSSPSSGEQKNALEETIASTLKSLAESAKSNADPNSTEPTDPELMAKMFENNGEFADVMENMVKQLLSKSVLYEPLKEMSIKYPKYLEEKKQQISPQDLERYTRQFSFVMQICDVYEKDENNVQKICTLMQQMQECGHPPVELIQEMAPGADFKDENLSSLMNLLENDKNCSVM